MNISLSIFDVFASAVPGSVYLATSLYLAVRWGWLDVDDLAGLDTTFALVAAILVSYLLGQVPGPALRKVAERVRLEAPSAEHERVSRRAIILAPARGGRALVGG